MNCGGDLLVISNGTLRQLRGDSNPKLTVSVRATREDLAGIRKEEVVIFPATHVKEVFLNRGDFQSIHTFQGVIGTAQLTLACETPGTAEYLVSLLILTIS